MAKKAAKKSSTKKATATVPARIGGITLNARQMAQAKKCLERSGKIKFGFKDVTVTRLPKSISPIGVFMD